MIYIFLTFKSGAVFSRKVSVECNGKVMAVNVTLKNDDVHDTITNVTIETFVDLQNILVGVKLFFPESKNEECCTSEYFRTSVDVRRISKALKGNTLVRMVTEEVAKSMDFKLEFPIKKVSRFPQWSTEI